jgi:hypothetical protein
LYQKSLTSLHLMYLTPEHTCLTFTPGLSNNVYGAWHSIIIIIIIIIIMLQGPLQTQ